MRMGRKAVAGLDSVFIDHAQAAKTHKARIVVVAERKRVVRIQPPVVGVATFFGRSYLNHCPLPSGASRSSSRGYGAAGRTNPCLRCPDGHELAQPFFLLIT